MKRRWFTPAMVCASLALLGAACGNNGGTAASGSPSGSLPGTGHKICFVADTGGIADKSFNQQIYEGLTKAQTDLGIQLLYVVSKSSSDYAPNIQAYVNQGDCDLIVLAGFNMGDALVTSAKANPDQKYAIVDYDIYDFTTTPPTDVTLPNVAELTFQTDQAAFLAGYLAAGVTKTGTVATYGGVNSFPTITIFMNGFAAGIRDYNKENGTTVKLLGWNPEKQKGVEVSTDTSVAFTDTAEGKSIAEDFINSGADIIMPVAGGTGLGTMTAAKSAGNVYGIWVDTDGCVSDAPDCPLFLTTVEKHMNVAVENTVKSVLDGTFKGGLTVGTLANDGVGIADYHQLSSMIPQALQDKITQLKQGIIAGTVSVDPKDYPAG